MDSRLSHVVPQSYTGIYSMHKYWSKKPFNIISRYVETYTDPNDIVLDPFSGSGISSIESVFLGRRTVGIDINPMSIFITRQMLSSIDIQEMEKEFLSIKKDVHERINGLYEISIDGRSFTGTHFIHKNGELREVWYKKDKVKKIADVASIPGLKTPDNFTYKDIKTFIPTRRMVGNSRINAKEDMSICDLFTPRNALALSILLDRINRMKSKELRELFRFCFTSCSGQASKMVYVINNRKKMKGKNTTSNRKEIGSWAIGYWIPKEHFEINAWNCFENRYKRILKSKKEFVKSRPDVRYARNFEDLTKDNNNVCLINDSCYTVLKELPSNSIDYIITDPPHGNRLPYLELSMMWNSWLCFDADMEGELVVSNAKSRNKTVAEYVGLLEKILVEIGRVLKNGKYFTLMFNSYDNETWKKLQEILFGLDLELSDVSTIGYSASSVVQNSRKGGLKTDFIFTFRKRENMKSKRHGIATEKIINSLISEYLENNSDRSRYKLLNHVIIHLMRKRLSFEMASVISSISLYCTRIS